MFDKPNYVKLYEEGSFPGKIQKAYEFLKECVLCPRECGVNRIKEEKGFCGSKRKVEVASSFSHFGEERPLVGCYGSGTIFVSHCNLKCVFCQNYDISHMGSGTEVSTGDLAKIMLRVQEMSCHNINVVSPTHVMPQIMAALFLATKRGLKIPFVYNTGGYDSPDLIDLLDGVVDIYLPDIKFGDDERAKKYTGAEKYFTYAKKNLTKMYEQVGPLSVNDNGIGYKGVVVRHLVLPGDLANSREVFRLIKSISPKIPVNVMGQYFPSYKASLYDELNKRPGFGEILQAKKWARELGLSVLD